MGLVEQLKIKSDQISCSQQEVINEIVLNFKQYLDSGKFEHYLESSIHEEELKSRAKTLRFEFWEYKSGCSKTYFNMAGWCFGVDQNTTDPYSYKGVRLKDIQKPVIDHCLQYLYEKLIQWALNLQLHLRDMECIQRLKYCKVKLKLVGEWN